MKNSILALGFSALSIYGCGEKQPPLQTEEVQSKINAIVGDCGCEYTNAAIFQDRKVSNADTITSEECAQTMTKILERIQSIAESPDPKLEASNVLKAIEKAGKLQFQSNETMETTYIKPIPCKEE